MRRTWAIRFVVAGSTLLAWLIVLAAAGSGEIPRKVNYQGRLLDAAGAPLAGAHTVVFRIFDSEGGGTELWAESQPVVADSAGVFAATLGSVDSIDAGFDGPRWLEVAVDGEILSPRREMVSVPFAFQAANAHMVAGLHADAFADSAHSHHQLDAADGDPAGAVFVDAVGKVGVGTQTPSASLDVAGTARVGGFALAAGAAAGRVLTSDAAGSGTWQPPQVGPASPWVVSGDNMYSGVSGNIGIGTSSPMCRLEITDSSTALNRHGLRAILTSPEGDGGTAVLGVTASGATGGLHSTGVAGVASSFFGSGIGVYGESQAVNGAGVEGLALHSSGMNHAVYGETFSPNGYAGYFKGGRNYFEGHTGIGVTNPVQKLHVSDTATGMLKYAIKLENRSNAEGAATGILFKVDTDLPESPDRGKGGLVYERSDSWNRGNFHILQDSGANTDVASLDDAVFTVRNSGKVIVGKSGSHAKLTVSEPSDATPAVAIYAACTSTTSQNATGVIGSVESEDVSNGGVGVVGWATGQAGNGVGVWGDGAGATGSGVYGTASHTTGRNFGVAGHTYSPYGYAGYFTGGRSYFEGNVGIGTSEPAQPLHVVNTIGAKGVTAVYAHVSNPGADSAFAIYARTDSNDPETYGAAVRGVATSAVGRSVGVEGIAAGTEGFGMYARATSPTGYNYGIYSSVASPDGYASYFLGGRNYFQGRVGIGLPDQPVSMLHVAGDPVSSGGVAGYDEVEAIFRNPYMGHTAISVDARLTRDAIIYLAEDADAVWDLRNDVDGHKFQLRYHGGVGLGYKYVTVDSTGRTGIGTDSPMQRLHVSDLASASLKYALKLDNPGVPNGTATGILFKVDGNDVTHPDRGKGAIVYERKDLYNRGDFHVLQNAAADMEVVGLADAVVTIKNNGNVGIGTKSPGYKLQVGAAGDGTEARANAWGLLSSREYKRDVEPLGPAQCREILGKAVSTDVVRYSFTNDPAAVEHIGVIAEDSPSEIVAADGKGVSLGDYAAFLLAAIKAQQAEIEELRAQVKDLQARVGGQ